MRVAHNVLTSANLPFGWFPAPWRGPAARSCHDDDDPFLPLLRVCSVARLDIERRVYAVVTNLKKLCIRRRVREHVKPTKLAN